MHDIVQLRVDQGGDPEKFRELCRRRFRDVDHVDQILAADTTWRQLQGKIDEMRKQYNARSREVGELMKKKEDASAVIAANKQLDAEIKQEEEKLENASIARDALLRTLPNFVHDSVPVSKDENENAVVMTFGTPRTDEGVKSHVDVLYMADMVDYERGIATAGGRGYYLTGDGVMLNQALINFGLQFLYKKGYKPIQTPFFMQKSIMQDVAQLSQFDEELYKVTGEGEDKYLIATSEQPICAFHRREWIHPSDVPKRYCGYSTCFRKEVGSHGRDTTGIFRIHQFEKLEQFCITTPDDDQSWQMLEEMRDTAAEFYKELGLPYRVVNIVSGELNDAAAKKYDLEAWFPNSKVFRELVSASNCLDYQSRRLDIRYGTSGRNKQQTGPRDKKYVHMLNATLCATERTMCCIAENYQTPEGIRVPEVLRPFMLGKEFIPFTREAPPLPNQPKAAAGGAAAK